MSEANILDALDASLRRGEDVRPIVGAFFHLAQQADRETRDDMLGSLAVRIGAYPAEQVAPLAILAGALVELGADPERFPQSVFAHLLGLLSSIEGPEDPRALPECFGPMQQSAMAYLSRSAALRTSLPIKADLLPRLVRYQERYSFLGKMLQVLDDEPLVVLHPATRRGWRFMMGGIADNFQLHLLLLGALAGDGPARIPGAVPSPEALAAAREGDAQGDEVVTSDWQLVNASGVMPGGALAGLDHHEAWIWNEGVPADIEVFEGQRVVLVETGGIQRSWNAQRVFPAMASRLDAQGTLSEPEVVAMLGRMGARAVG
jgi:hypothetical protein